MPGSNYQYINSAATTVIGSALYRRVNCLAIFINKTTVGTVTVKSGAVTIGVFAVGTPPNTYWLTDNGIEVPDMQIVTSAADDIVIAYCNL